MKPTSEYGSEMWVLGEEGKMGIEASEVRYLQPLLGVSLRDKIRGIDIKRQLGAELTDEIQEYQRKWHNHVEGMPPVHLSWHAF
jgi:hypothetical protein